jgi:hypothetical protein
VGRRATACAVSAVALGLLGSCAYQAQQRASGWLTVETRHVQLRTTLARDAAVQLAQEMQRAYDVLTHYALPCAHIGEQDRAQVTALPDWQIPELRPGAGGFYGGDDVTWLADYEGQIVVPDQLDSSSTQVFQHELTHWLAAACFTRMPSWLNEGLAGFFETMRVTPNSVTLGLPPYEFSRGDDSVSLPRATRRDGQSITVVPLNTLPSLDSVFTHSGPWISHSRGDTTRRYATAWALVHLLLVGAPDLAPVFERYLAELQTSRGDPRAAFARAFDGVPLQDRLNVYLRRPSMDLLRSGPPAAAALQEPASIRVRAMPSDEAHLHLAWLSRGLDERFRLHIEEAKRSSRTRTAAHLLAAAARLADRDFAGAEREIREGQRGDPDNVAFLEAQVDILLARKAPPAELDAAVAQLRPRAVTAGQICTLATVALRMGDRKTAQELSERSVQLRPRLAMCRFEALVREAAGVP